MTSYTTVKKTAEDQFTEKRSRFLCAAAPVQTVEQAEQFIAQRREAHRDARHTVWAYLLRKGEVRCSDDGEPQGTGGVPVLEVIRREGIVDVCVVVTRYFGGVLLGAPGLTRAYSAGASKALGAAGRQTMTLCTEFCIDLEYAHYNKLAKILESFGATVSDSNFGERVVLMIAVDRQTVPRFVDAITELTAAAVVPRETREVFIPKPE